MGSLTPLFCMNDKFENNYSVSIRIGNSVEYLSLDAFAALCDKFLLQEILDLFASSPLSTVIYSGYRNQVKFTLQLYPKEN